MSEEIKKFKVTIDGQTTEVEPGTTILNAARQIGGKSVPPAMCYYSKLPGTGGKCRTCLVEVAAGSAADPRVRWTQRVREWPCRRSGARCGWKAAAATTGSDAAHRERHPAL
mgnify:CR=1 FL=1